MMVRRKRRIIKYPASVLEKISRIMHNCTGSNNLAWHPVFRNLSSWYNQSSIYLSLKEANSKPSGEMEICAIITAFCNPNQWIDKEPIRRDVVNMLNDVLYAIDLQVMIDGSIKHTTEKILYNTDVDIPDYVLEKRPMELMPIFQARSIKRMERVCFFLMPFQEPFNTFYRDFLKPKLEARGLICSRADDIYSPTDILEDIWINICRSNIIIADVTGRNSNVFYEMGIAHTVGKPVIIVTQNKDDIPFDISHFRYFLYEPTQSSWNTVCNSIISSLDSISI